MIPDLGHCGSGRFARGRVSGLFSELDVIDGYYRQLVEEIDADRVRHEVLETREPPGANVAQRIAEARHNELVIVCRAGWDQTPRKGKNVTRVFYGESRLKPLALELSESMAEWGGCYVFGHRAARPDERADLKNANGALVIAVEPFSLNGSDTDQYLPRLEQLGRALGRTIAGYCRSREWAQIGGVAGF